MKAPKGHKTYKAYVVFCHPRHESFGTAMLERTLAGLHAGGHEVRVCDLYAEGFDPDLTADVVRAQLVDHREHPEARPGIQPYVDDLLWCDALVFVHPTWWSGQPAMLKGFIDRVFVKGVAWDLPDGATRLRPRLAQIRRIVTVTSHGSPKHTNMVQGESGKRIASRSLRVMCHRFCRTRWIALYDIDRASEADRTAFLARVERRLQRP